MSVACPSCCRVPGIFRVRRDCRRCGTQQPVDPRVQATRNRMALTRQRARRFYLDMPLFSGVRYGD